MLASIGALLRFYRCASRVWLAVAAFSAGLWMWDKAVGMWMLSGMVLAVAILFPREAWSRVNRTDVAVAVAAFCVGAFPLILFNVKNHYPTFRSNAHFSTVGFGNKVAVLKGTANDLAWFGTVVSEPGAQLPRAPHTQIARWSVALHDFIGDRRTDYMPYALGASLLLVPVLLFLRNYHAVRLLLFILIVACAAWLQMAFTEGAGTGAHYPASDVAFPEFFIAVAFAEASLALKNAC